MFSNTNVKNIMLINKFIFSDFNFISTLFYLNEILIKAIKQFRHNNVNTSNYMIISH